MEKNKDCGKCFHYYADGNENGYNTLPYCHDESGHCNMVYDFEVEYTLYYAGKVKADSYAGAVDKVMKMADEGFSPFSLREGHITNVSITK